MARPLPAPVMSFCAARSALIAYFVDGADRQLGVPWPGQIGVAIVPNWLHTSVE